MSELPDMPVPDEEPVPVMDEPPPVPDEHGPVKPPHGPVAPPSEGLVLTDIINPAFIRFIAKEFALGFHSPHGPSHWFRVFHNGMLIADNVDNVDRKVVGIFAILHDHLREDEGIDKYHGFRAGIMVDYYAKGGQPRPEGKESYTLTNKQLDLLRYAVAHHSSGELSTNPTISACWDADRLDLWRVGTVPAPQYMSTSYAQENDVIDAASDRAEEWRKIIMLRRVRRGTA